jgi:hypothetical protein
MKIEGDVSVPASRLPSSQGLSSAERLQLQALQPDPSSIWSNPGNLVKDVDGEIVVGVGDGSIHEGPSLKVMGGVDWILHSAQKSPSPHSCPAREKYDEFR